MYKKIIISILIFAIATLLLQLNITKSYAADGTILGIFYDNNSGTAWQVRARIYDPNSGWTGYAYVTTNSTITNLGSTICTNCGLINFGQHDTDSSVQWATACIDPIQDYRAGVYCSTCSPVVFAFMQNVTCPVGANSVRGQPANCQDPNGWGTVSFNSWCPSGNYCMYAGSAGDWCPNAFDETQVKGTRPSSCNDYSYLCHRSYCDSSKNCHNLVADDTRINCDTAACACPYSSDPATPSLNNETGLTCSGVNNPNNVTVSWDAAARTQNYTLYYRDCGIGNNNCPGWTSVDKNLNRSHTITIPNGDQGHTYRWFVRASSCAGTTDSAVANFTVPWCPWEVTAHVFVDNNGTGSQAAADPDYDSTNNIIRFSGARPSSGYTDMQTNANGDAVMTNIPAGGSETVALLTSNLPPGWTVSSATPATRTVTGPPPSFQTVNFGIQPPAPTCTGLTATYTVNGDGIYQGQTSNVSCTGLVNPFPSQAPVYNWTVTTIPTPLTPPATPGTIAATTPGNSRYSAPANARPTTFTAYANLRICNQGGGLCSNYSVPIRVYPLFAVSGNVFIDSNKNNIKDAGEANFLAGINGEISINPLPAGATSTINSGAGTYSFSNIPQGTYTISYSMVQARAAGYFPQWPGNGTPQTFSATVGLPCSVSPLAVGQPTPCQTDAAITGLNFGITDSVPWMQSVGGDIYDNGFVNPIPAGATLTTPYGGGGPYSSVYGNGSTPGIIYSGTSNPDFGPNGDASANPPFGWIVGGTAYPETFITRGAPLRTSFGRIDSLIDEYDKRSELIDLSTVCSLAACDLGTIPSGMYIAYNNLSVINSTVSNNKHLIILVGDDRTTPTTERDLTINGRVLVANGSTLFFTVSGNITIPQTVGEAAASYCQVPSGANAFSTNCSIEGYYSTDHSFVILGGGSGLCTSGGSDLRLNIGGSVVVNAAGAGGGFSYNSRDLCANGSIYPVFSITERPDFILNSPAFFKTQKRVWQELAP